MSQSRKPTSEMELDTLTDQFRSSLNCNDDNINKPDFQELDLGSPISPLRTGHSRLTTTIASATTSSSSSSSGSVTRRNGFSSLPKRSDSGGTNNYGELSVSVNSSPIAPGSKQGQSASDFIGPHPPIYSDGNSVSSPALNVFPNGNICPSGKILKTGMASRCTRTDVLGLGTGNYGHGSIMRGGVPTSVGSVDGGIGSTVNSRGSVGGDSVKRELCSNDPEELKKAGNERYKKGHFEEALSLYDKAVALFPSNAAYHCNRAAALIGLKRLGEAVRECQEAIKLDPGYVRANHRLGSLFLSLGQVENARRHLCFPGHQPDPVELQKLQAVEKHVIKCTDARKVSDWRSAMREVDAAIVSGANVSPQLLACRAEAHLKLHQLDDADFSLSHIPKFESSFPTFSQAKFFGMLSEAYLFFVQAQIDMALGRFENALAAVEMAGQIDPRNIEISVLLNNVRLVGRARVHGNDLFKSARFTEACSAYSEGLRLDPSNSILYCNRAACWYKLGDWEQSINDCNQALRIQPNYMKAFLRRASSNVKLKNWTKAVRDYEVLRRELPLDKEVAEYLFHAKVALKKSREGGTNISS